MSERECVFCELLADRLAARWIAREEGAAALFPLVEDSLAPGHTLVISTTHVVGVQYAEPSVLGNVMALVQRVAVAMDSALGAAGVNVLNASGDGSEQSVPHLRFHVVPRWTDDGWTTRPAARSNKRFEHDATDAPATALMPGRSQEAKR